MPQNIRTYGSAKSFFARGGNYIRIPAPTSICSTGYAKLEFPNNTYFAQVTNVGLWLDSAVPHATPDVAYGLTAVISVVDADASALLQAELAIQCVDVRC
jgi:hypothetical protein